MSVSGSIFEMLTMITSYNNVTAIIIIILYLLCSRQWVRLLTSLPHSVLTGGAPGRTSVLEGRSNVLGAASTAKVPATEGKAAENKIRHLCLGLEVSSAPERRLGGSVKGMLQVCGIASGWK